MNNTLGKRPNRKVKDEINEGSGFVIPAVVRKSSFEIGLEKAIIYAFIAHFALAFIVWLFVFIMMLLGIKFALFEKPQPKIKDIEFVLVNNPEKMPINKKTRFRADRNTRAGGKHNPNKPVSEPRPSAAKASSSRAGSKPKAPKALRKALKKPRPQRPKPKQAKIPVPPKPVPHKQIPRPQIATKSNFPLPAPIVKAPKPTVPKNIGGPVTSAPVQDSIPTTVPAPVMSSSGSGGSSQGVARGRYSRGYSFGDGNAGNPGPGNPNGRPGIDALKEPDFGPYMRELQRRIKRNWDPPKGNESKRVVLMFKVSRDGRLLSLKVAKTSGSPVADRAAKAAVELTAPFMPLPPEYRGDDIDIQFTFDYNVFGLGAKRF